MDIMRLHGTTYTPNKMIEGYKSCIWTERYLDPGDFQITTNLVEKGMADMPIDTLLTHRETLEVGIVETQEIQTDQYGVDVLTIKGRTFESFYENRVAVQVETPNDPFDFSYWVIDDNTGLVARGILQDQIYGWFTPGHPPMSDLDIIPNLIVFPVGGVAAEDEGENANFKIEMGDVHTKAVDLLRGVGLGLRNARPVNGTGVTDMWTQIYRGVNRTVGQTANNPVILKTEDGHFDSVSYLFSNRGHKTVAYVFSGYRNGSGDMISTRIGRASGAGSGRNRRVLYVDASDITKLPSGHNITDMLKKRGRAALGKKENKKQSVFDGKVSATVPYKYNVHYGLGDLVTVQAKYGIAKTMMVNEYIRSESAEGDSGYPTLMEPNDF